METTFGSWLKQQRRVLDLTQQELAEKVGCSVVTIRKFESGERKPSKQLAELLSKYLNVAEADRAAFVAFARAEQVNKSISPTVTVEQFALWSTPTNKGETSGARSNLPSQITPFIGRVQELQEINERLSDPQCQLLTLVGPGGIGKTRLALAAAAKCVVAYPDGVYFVSLARVNSSNHLATTIADAVNLTLRGGLDASEQLIGFLRRCRILLVLDNFEHLLQPGANPEKAATLITSILTEANHVKLIVTSRERLMLQTEWVYQVQGLGYPQAAVVMNANLNGWLQAYDALGLFVSCARRVQTDFVLDEIKLPAVQRICQIVDGMPLGLELAASWLHILTVTEIAVELEQNISLLATQYRDVVERHRSLRSVFEHSWQFLSSVEQDVLKRLAIFQGGFDREAALKVAGTSLFYLTSLVNKSLVKHLASGRYEMHELLRQFCLEKLREVDGAEARIRDAHAAYFANWIEGKWDALTGLGEAEAMAAIEEEIDNVRVGWRRAVEQKEVGALEKYLKSLAHFYEIQGYYEEGLHVFEQAAQRLEADRVGEQSLLLVRLWSRLAVMYQYRDQIEKAGALLEKSLVIAQRQESEPDVAYTLSKMGDVSVFSGQSYRAADYFKQSLDVYESIDDEYGIVYALQGLGWAALDMKENELAHQYHVRNLPLLRKRGPKSLLAWTLFEMGLLALGRGTYDLAEQYLEEGKQVCEEINYQFALLSFLTNLAEVFLLRGEYRKAQSYAEAGLALHTWLQDATSIGYCLMTLTSIALLEDEEAKAEAYLEKLQAFSKSQREGFPLGWYHFIHGEWELKRGRLQEAEFHFWESLCILRAGRATFTLAVPIVGLGKTYFEAGEVDQAERQFRKALRLARMLPAMADALNAVLGIAEIHAQRGDTERAVELAITVQQHRASSYAAKERAAQLLNQLEDHVQGDAWNKMISSAKNLDPDVVVHRLR